MKTHNARASLHNKTPCTPIPATHLPTHPHSLVFNQTGRAWDTLPQTERAWRQYASNSSYDDALWAALWMYRSTSNDRYLQDGRDLLRKARDEGPVTVVG